MKPACEVNNSVKLWRIPLLLKHNTMPTNTTANSNKSINS